MANCQFKVAIASSKWRIVSSKWRSPVQSGNRQVRDDHTKGNNPPNRHLRYLVQNLRACQNNLEKARFMLQYFNGCSFNAGMCPDGVIRFSDHEAAQISQYVQELDEEDDAEIAEPEV